MNIKPTNFYSNWTDEELKKITDRNRLETGLPELDRLIKFPNGFYIICANPGVGKGWFALWLTRQFWKYYQKKSIYFNLEMEESLVRLRIQQAWSDLTQQQHQQGMSILPAVELMKKDVIVIDNFYQEDTKLRTPEKFLQLFDQYYFLGYRIFHFDHLHELEGMNTNDKNQLLSEKWSAVFKKINDEYKNVWLFIYAQPNGEASKKDIIKRTDIAGSKSITQRCEFFLSLNRKQKQDFEELYEEERDVFVYLDKGRTESKTHVGEWIRLDETGNFTSRNSHLKSGVMDFICK